MSGEFARYRLRFMCVAAMAAAVLPFAAGCYGLSEMLTPYDLVTDGDGDGSLETATPVTWRGDKAMVDGGISIDQATVAYMLSFLPGTTMVGNFLPPPSEVDVYGLGRLDAGDEISVGYYSLLERVASMTPMGQTEAGQTGLKIAFALVNERSEVVGYPAAGPVYVGEAGEYFIVVQTGIEDARLPFDYRLAIGRRRGVAEPGSRAGVLLLQFDGGEDLNVTFPGSTLNSVLRVDSLPPFVLEEARPDFPGQTERFKQLVRDMVEYVYADFDVTVTCELSEAEAAGHYDVLVFTSVRESEIGLDGRALGIEPKLDVEDVDRQVGIIFVESNSERRLASDFYAFCAYWATVAAHEYGHAVGLFHTQQEVEELMAPRICGVSDACRRGLKAMARAPMVDSPMLIQNPALYLGRVLGFRDPAEAAAIREGLADLVPVDDWQD